MPNISGVNENIELVKKTYQKFLALGEGATGEDFRMTFDGYPNLEFLVQTTQLPPLEREPIEGFGPHGVQFVQQGRFKNAQEVPVSFKEVISGEAYKAIRECVKSKKYLTVTLALLGESETKSNQHNTVVMEDTWISLEGVDLDVETAALVKPTGTLHVNWITYLDPDVNQLEWGL